MDNTSPTNHPTAAATGVLLFGLLIAFLLKGEGTPSEVVRYSAVLVGLSIIVSFIAEIILTDARNLVRLDNAGIVALYFLTMFEFLFPQPFYNSLVTAAESKVGIDLVLLGLAAIALGRHMVSRTPFRTLLKGSVTMSPRDLFWLAVVCFFVGHLHMWLAVGFNPIEWLKQLSGARFTQDWQRGKLGGLSTLLGELQWMNCIVPAIAAILWVRRREISRAMLGICFLMLVLILFAGVSLGTRYQFAFYLLSFCGGFFLSLPSLRMKRILFLAVPIFTVFVVLTFMVVNFRSMGVKRVLDVVVFDESEGYSGARGRMLESLKSENGFKFIVDRNMYPISLLPGFFPDKYPFLEEEILWHIAVRPVPRALWPGKPESLSVTTEGILGVESATIASTFVGEGFMAYGRFGVVLFGVGLGLLSGIWNRIPVNQSDSAMIILYSTGFVWIAIAVRSVVWITVGFLPCVAFLVYAWCVFPLLKKRNESHSPILVSSEK